MDLSPGFKLPRHNPRTERMEDLPANPRLQKDDTDYTVNPYPDLPKKQLTKMRQQIASSQPKTRTKAPQLSSAQRRRNQDGQPRETDGKYAEKSGSKWKHFLSSEPGPQTSLKRVKKHPVQAKTLRSTKKRPVPISAVEHRNPLVKVRWWVTRGFRQWRRKKARQICKAFSLRG